MNEKSFWQRNQSDKAQRQIAREAKKFGLDKKALNIAYNMDKDLDAFDPALSKTLMPPREDLNYAIEKKVFLELPLHDHDKTIQLLRETISQIKRIDLVNAFVASLNAGRPDWRSPLASYAYHLHHPAHTARERELSWGQNCILECQVCGFRRDKNKEPIAEPVNRLIHLGGGGIHHEFPGYALADLLWFQESPKVEASAADWKTFANIVDAIQALPKAAGLKELNASLSGLVAGNKFDRQGVLETLGYCGILTAHSRPTVCNTWFRPDLELPPHFFKKEWRYPTCWWTGEEGLNQEAIQFWFPELGNQ